MSSQVSEAPNILISYSWSPPENADWVLELATQLRADGVDVKLDRWDLREGQDMLTFMESMALDMKIKHVILICNKDYTAKANNRQGGVGRESSIISPEVYDKTDQTKYIPIIREFYSEEDGELLNGKPCLPHYLKTRFSINFSDDSKFEDNYEQLIRCIYDKPLTPKPPLGKAPSYILEQTTQLRTTPYSKRLQKSIKEDSKNKQGLLKDYLDQIFLSLNDLEIKNINHDEDIDDVVLNRLADMKFLRDEIVETFLVYSRYSEFDQSFLVKIFEHLLSIYNAKGDDMNYDHYKFFGIELFLYISALLIKEEKFNELAALLHRSYLLTSTGTRNVSEEPFTVFTDYRIYSLEVERNRKLSPQKISVTADILKERADNPILGFNYIQQTEMLLHYVSLLKNIDPWLPYTVIFRREDMTLLQLLKSSSYFERFKVVLGVKDKDDLIQKVAGVIASGIETSYHSGRMSFPYLKDGLFVNEVSSFA
jgi:hypothetical protein